jgi:hypothetical protein
MNLVLRMRTHDDAETDWSKRYNPAARDKKCIHAHERLHKPQERESRIHEPGHENGGGAASADPVNHKTNVRFLQTTQIKEGGEVIG